MKKLKRHHGILFIVLALVIVALTIGGCGSSTTTTNGPAPLPSQTPAPSEGGDIEPNDSIVSGQIALFLSWDGSYPREMRVFTIKSNDVAGLVNYTKDKIGKEIDLIIDEDLDWLMLGQQITGNVQLRANPEGGTSYYINNITH